MSLEPALIVSPRAPFWHSYDPSSPDAPYLAGLLDASGVNMHSTIVSRTLSGQFENDELILGGDPVPAGDEGDITDWSSQVHARCVVRLTFAGFNLSADRQYLLVFGFKNRWTAPGAMQFFVGNKWVRSETIDDRTETVALLLDHPGTSSHFGVSVMARLALAANEIDAVVGFTGVQGYIL